MITIISIIPIIVAAIAGAIGIFALLFSIRQKNLLQISFAFTALTVMLYGIVTTGLYNATTLAEAITAQRFQSVAINLFVISYFYFIIHYLKLKYWQKNFWFWLVISFIIMIPQLFIRNSLIWDLNNSTFHMVKIFGFTQIIIEANPGIITQITVFLGAIVFIFFNVLIIYHFRGHKNFLMEPLVISSLVLLITFLHDMFIALGFYDSIYVLELGFLVIIGMVTFLLAKNILDTLKTKEALEEANKALEIHKEELEKIVAERTHDFQYQAEFYRTLVNNIPIAIVSLDNNQRVRAVNPAFEKMFGIPLAEARNIDLDEVIVPKDQLDVARSLTERIMRNMNVYMRGKRKRKDGTLVDVEITGVPIIVGGQQVGGLGLYSDISESLKAEKALKDSEIYYRSLFEDSPISLWDEDYSAIKSEIDRLKVQGVDNLREYFSENPDIVYKLMHKIKVINVNQASSKMFKAKDKDELIHKKQNIFPPESLPSLGEKYAALAGDSMQWIGEMIHKDFNHETIYSVHHASIAPGYEDTWGKVFLSVLDITERKNNEMYLQYISSHDQLTGLAIRSLLYDRLTHAINQAERNHRMVAVLFMDLDGFKGVNDQHGHQIGDQLLVQLSQRMSRKMRKSDTIARIGGDEFVIVLENLSKIEEVEPVVKKAIEITNEPFVINDIQCRVTLSIGISIYPQDDEIAEELIKKADLAMYKAKAAGKGRYCFYNDESNLSL